MSSPQAIGPFAKGLNTADPPGSLEKDELVNCSNWYLDEFGILIKRPGSQGYGSSPAKLSGDNAIKLIERYYKTSGAKKTIAIANGIMAFGDDPSGAWTVITPPAAWTGSTTRIHDTFTFKNRLYVLGGSYPVRYDGTNLLATGHFQHVTAGWVSSIAVAGVIPDGTYKYMITSVQGDLGEGGYTDTKTVVVTAGPKQVQLTSIDVASAAYGVTNKQVWRTHVGGSLYYRLPDGLITAGATSYTDNNLDANLVDEYDPVSGPPTDARYAIVGADDRVYYFGMGSGNETIVQVSDIGFPDRIVDNLFFSVAAGDGRIVSGAGLVPNGIVFFKPDSMWMWEGVGYGLRPIKSSLGCKSRFSIAQLPDGLIFLSSDGEAYFYDGVNEVNIGRGVKDQFANQTEASSQLIVATYYPRDLKYLIAYDYLVGSGFNNRLLEFDLVGKKWDGPHANGPDLCISQFSVWNSLDDLGELLYGEARATNGSYVYKRNDGLFVDRYNVVGAAVGAPYESIARTGVYFFDTIGEKKFFKVFGRAKISSGTIVQVRIYSDDETSYTIAELFLASITGNSSLIWNTGLWGINNWAGKIISVAEDTYAPTARGRRPSIEIRDLASTSETTLESLDLLVQILQPK